MHRQSQLRPYRESHLGRREHRQRRALTVALRDELVSRSYAPSYLPQQARQLTGSVLPACHDLSKSAHFHRT
jgi:hypothetical protein